MRASLRIRGQAMSVSAATRKSLVGRPVSDSTSKDRQKQQKVAAGAVAGVLREDADRRLKIALMRLQIKT
jgi:hypothetical protein